MQDYCRDFSWSHDSGLVSLLKVRYKNKIFMSVKLLYYFKENQKGRKQSDRHIYYKIL